MSSLQEIWKDFAYGIYLPFFLLQLSVLITFSRQLRKHLRTKGMHLSDLSNQSFKFMTYSAFSCLAGGTYFTFYWSILWYTFYVTGINEDVQNTLFVGHTDVLSIIIYGISIESFYVFRLIESFRGSLFEIKTSTRNIYLVFIVMNLACWIAAWVGFNNFLITNFWYMYAIGCVFTLFVLIGVTSDFVRKLHELVVMQRADPVDVESSQQTRNSLTSRRSIDFMDSKNSQANQSIAHSNTQNYDYQKSRNSKLSNNTAAANPQGGNKSNEVKVETNQKNQSKNNSNVSNASKARQEPSVASRSVETTTTSPQGRNSRSRNSIVRFTRSGGSKMAMGARSRTGTQLNSNQQPLVKIATKQTVLLGVDGFIIVILAASIVLFPDGTYSWLPITAGVAVVSITIWLSFVFAENQYKTMCCCCDAICYKLCLNKAVHAVDKQERRMTLDEFNMLPADSVSPPHSSLKMVATRSQEDAMSPGTHSVDRVSANLDTVEEMDDDVEMDALGAVTDVTDMHDAAPSLNADTVDAVETARRDADIDREAKEQLDNIDLDLNLDGDDGMESGAPTPRPPSDRPTLQDTHTMSIEMEQVDQLENLAQYD